MRRQHLHLLLLTTACGVLDYPHDLDGDGVTVEDGDLCDADPTRYPGQIELPDHVDNDCDNDIDEGTLWDDADGDGFCEEGDENGQCVQAASVPGDCDDNEPASWPGAAEIDDDLDNDCDDLIDEDLDTTDDDGDGFADVDGDCNDYDATIFPTAVETCNWIDDDCDQQIDEDFDIDVDEWTDCAGDWAPNDPTSYPGATEICDDLDNNGNGQIDEGFDADLDGVTDCNDCAPDDSTIYPGAGEVCGDNLDNDCDGRTDAADIDSGDDDADGFGRCADCNPDDRSIYPGATETLNGIDDNCDGEIDEGLDPDDDGDGYRSSQDCDDTDASISPDATDVYNGVDDDCDGTVDQGYSTETISIRTLSELAPILTRGDAEFAAHGPMVDIDITLSIVDNLFLLTIEGIWEETKSDWTTGQLDYTDTVYSASSDCSILEMEGPDGATSASSLSESFGYTDSDHSVDDLGGSGFVDHLWVRGDTDDDDIGAGTRIEEVAFGIVVVTVYCPS